MLEALALAFGVAMDASAVAAARGLARDARLRDGLVLALVFGVFQAAMAALGFLLAHVGDEWFAAIDHWIAAGTLVAIGIKMVRDAWRGYRVARAPTSAVTAATSDAATSAARAGSTSAARSDAATSAARSGASTSASATSAVPAAPKGSGARFPWRTSIALAIATSVDAAAVGMSLPLVRVDPSLAITMMGIVTFACAAAAHALARAIGRCVDRGMVVMEAIGGLVLIAIGVRVLVEHL